MTWNGRGFTNLKFSRIRFIVFNGVRCTLAHNRFKQFIKFRKKQKFGAFV